MSIVARLRAVLSADTSRFEQGMRGAQRRTESFGSTVSKIFKRSLMAVSGFALGAAAALTAMTRSSMNAQDEQVKLARSLGITNREFGALSQVAREAGIDQNALANSIRTSQQAIQNARRGLSTYTRAFDELGLSIKELENLTPDQQFERIAQSLSQVEDRTQRLTLAQELFGRQGRQILNIVDDISDSLDDAREFQDKFNLSLSDVDASKIEEANDTVGRVRQSFGGLGNVLANEFSPIITELGNRFLESGADAESFSRSVQRGMEVAGGAIDVVRKAILGFRSIFLDIMLGIDLMIMNATTNLWNFARTAENIPLIGDQFREMQSGFVALNQAAQMSAKQTLKDIDNLEKGAESFKRTIDVIREIQADAEDRASARVGRDAPSLAGVTFDGEGVAEEVGKASSSMKALGDEAKRSESVISQAQRGIESGFSGLFDALRRGESGFRSLRDTALRALSDIADSLFRQQLNQFIQPLTSSLFGSVSSFATGSRYVPRDMVARVHQGEMIVPRSQVGSGGGDVNINVVNNAGSNVDMQRRNTGDGVDIDIIIDQAVAENINKTGSRTNAALSSFTNRSLVRR